MINRFFAFAAEAERGGDAGSSKQERPESWVTTEQLDDHDWKIDFLEVFGTVDGWEEWTRNWSFDAVGPIRFPEVNHLPAE